MVISYGQFTPTQAHQRRCPELRLWRWQSSTWRHVLWAGGMTLKDCTSFGSSCKSWHWKKELKWGKRLPCQSVCGWNGWNLLGKLVVLVFKLSFPWPDSSASVLEKQWPWRLRTWASKVSARRYVWQGWTRGLKRVLEMFTYVRNIWAGWKNWWAKASQLHEQKNTSMEKVAKSKSRVKIVISHPKRGGCFRAEKGLPRRISAITRSTPKSRRQRHCSWSISKSKRKNIHRR